MKSAFEKAIDERDQARAELDALKAKRCGICVYHVLKDGDTVISVDDWRRALALLAECERDISALVAFYRESQMICLCGPAGNPIAPCDSCKKRYKDYYAEYYKKHEKP